VRPVAHKFHARHDAVARTYLYQISRRRTAFGKPFVWWIRERLDLDAMCAAADAFVGMKDFAAFTDDDPEEKSTRVLVERLELSEAGALILIRIQGSHFLWKMVRRIVGVLAAVGRGELAAGDAARFLDDRLPDGALTKPAALTAPAAGLFLEGVYYKGEAGPGPVRPLIAID
jgi:tRNA pseudouridine38-40 synthase